VPGVTAVLLRLKVTSLLCDANVLIPVPPSNLNVSPIFSDGPEPLSADTKRTVPTELRQDGQLTLPVVASNISGPDTELTKFVVWQLKPTPDHVSRSSLAQVGALIETLPLGVVDIPGPAVTVVVVVTPIVFGVF
jgi:hypothetical protein